MILDFVFDGIFDGEPATKWTATLIDLLPPGRLWRIETTSVLYKLLAGLADELQRVEDRGQDLLEEWDPRTAEETLDQWESALGLPNTWVPVLPVTTEQRRAIVAMRYIANGGQSAAYYQQLVETAG